MGLLFGAIYCFVVICAAVYGAISIALFVAPFRVVMLCREILSFATKCLHVY